MSFAWPLMLFALALVPASVGAYSELLRRRQERERELGSMRLADGRTGRRPGRRRHVPFALFLAGVALLLVALARPQMTIALPRMEGTVILAFDVSSSMIADDLEPSRMEAAKAAASAFVEDQPSSVLVGVVAFSRSALVVQQPTDLKSEVLAAIGRLSPEGGTSVADGILASLGAISGKPIVLDEAALEGDLSNVEIGYFGSAVIVMLSDGENTSQPEPLLIAELAANAGVRVFPIGVGSPGGTTVEIDGFRVATALNEELLQGVATVTGGTYFRAEDTEQLKEIYDSIDLKLTTRGEKTEVTALLAGASLLLVLVGAALSMRWFGRVP